MVVKATLRVDNRDDDTLSRLQSFLSRYEKYLVYEEVSDKQKKLHYQGVVYVNSDKEYNAMKVRFSTHFKDWEKGSKSMSLVKKDTYEVYITKDGKQVFNQGFSEEEVENLQKQSYKKEDKTKLNKLDKLMQYCKENNYHWSDDGWKLCILIQKYYLENNLPEPNDFQIKCYVKSIYLRYMTEKSREKNNPAILDNYMRERAYEIMGPTWTR